MTVVQYWKWSRVVDVHCVVCWDVGCWLSRSSTSCWTLLAWFLFKNFLHLFSFFVYNKIVCFIVGKHTILLLQKNIRSIYILLLAYTCCTYTTLSRAVNTSTCLWQSQLSPKITSPRGGCLTLAMQPSINCKLSPNEVALFGSKKAQGWRRHTVEKAWPFHTWSTAKGEQSDCTRGVQLLYCNVPLVSQSFQFQLIYFKHTNVYFMHASIQHSVHSLQYLKQCCSCTYIQLKDFVSPLPVISYCSFIPKLITHLNVVSMVLPTLMLLWYLLLLIICLLKRFFFIWQEKYHTRVNF